MPMLISVSFKCSFMLGEHIYHLFYYIFLNFLNDYIFANEITKLQYSTYDVFFIDISANRYYISLQIVLIYLLTRGCSSGFTSFC
uniref:Ovule protein n=1 Tax=Heterorhabditis bacteriophora TaxID=37862 RepID=A0A1I7WQA2_HETBA